jgi:hypothetical protein
VQTLAVFTHLRRDTIDRIARHDPQFALAFLRATRLPEDEKDYDRSGVDLEQSLELHLAEQIAAQDPKLALKLGREYLEKSFSSDLLEVLFRLQRRDKEATLSLYNAIVDKLKDVNLVEDSSARGLALDLARSFQPPGADEQTYRELIGIVLQNAIRAGCAKEANDDSPYFCNEISPVVSRMEKYYAQKAAPLKRWVDSDQEADAGQAQMRSELREVEAKGTIDELLELATKYPAMQAQVYFAAMNKAEEAGDIARARQIAASCPAEETRRYGLEHLDRYQIFSSLNAEKLATIQQQLNSLPAAEGRIQFLLFAASQVGVKDRKVALDLLTQAGQIVESMKPGKGQLAGQIQLALGFCLLKSDRGFAIMESLLPKLNELVAAAVTLDGIENSYLRDGEWNMTGEGVLGSLLTDLAQSAGYFARADFDRSVILAGQFERPELRLMAQLKIAQSILSNTTGPLPEPPYPY